MKKRIVIIGLLTLVAAQSFAYMMPEKGRWPSRDPLGERGGGRHLYRFVDNSPVNSIDPIGLWKRLSPSGHVWEAESGNSLWTLANKAEYGGRGVNWPCLWPVMGTQDHGYPSTIRPCDKYDASNLADVPGVTLKLRVSSDVTGLGGTLIDAGATSGHIRTTSGQGGTPIGLLIISGHGGPGGMGGSYVPVTTGIWPFSTTTYVWTPPMGPLGFFNATQYQALPNPAPSFARASSRKGPKRCWFTRKANVWLAGCHTSTVAQGLAGVALRIGATAHGTTSYTAFSPTSVTYGPNITIQNGLPVWGAGTTTSANWQDPAVWSSYSGGL